MNRTAFKFCSLLAVALAATWPLAQAAEEGEHMFKKLDANGDGQLSRDEVKAAPMLSGKFDEIDTDKNGQLSKAEVRAYFASHKDERAEHKDEMMARMDADGDGFVSREEAAKFPRLAAAFDKLDTNHDGKLSPDELKAIKRQ